MNRAERVTQTCDRIKRAWLAHPSLRLGQIISNLVDTEETLEDLFYIEDLHLAEAIEDYLARTIV